KEIQNAMLLFLFVSALSVPLWIWISRRWGRKFSLVLGSFLIFICNLLVIPSVSPGDVQQAYLLISGLAAVLIASSILLESALTDVIDFDFLRSGEERWGLFFGIWKFVSKLSRTIALLMLGFLLDWANIAFPDIDTPERLMQIFGPGVGLL